MVRGQEGLGVKWLILVGDLGFNVVDQGLGFIGKSLGLGLQASGLRVYKFSCYGWGFRVYSLTFDVEG